MGQQIMTQPIFALRGLHPVKSILFYGNRTIYVHKINS